jgi:hypothetical protein
MRDRVPLVLLIGVLALLGVKSLSSGPSTSGADGKPPPGQSETAGKRSQVIAVSAGKGNAPFLQPLVEFLRPQAKPGFVDPDGYPDKEVLGQYDPRVMIATVPDPVDSGSGYRFDSVVDTIQRAAEARGYVLDRYYYPWRAEKTQGPPPTGPVEGPVRGKASAAPNTPPVTERPRVWERQPGMLLFRGKFPPSPRGSGAGSEHRRTKLLIVFLVGETATAGIHRVALRKSLGFLDHYQLPSRQPVGILGPFFSGSQVSLALTLQDWRKAPRPGTKVHLLSGSATALDPGWLEAELRGRFELVAQTTVIPEHTIFLEMLSYLGVAERNDEGVHFKEKVALLYESNTGFGRAVWRNIRAAKGRQGQESNLLAIPFPMHISQVRAGYGKAGDLGKGDPLSLPARGGKLRIPFQEESEARDLPPALQPTMTAATAELTLTALLGSLTHERLRYAVITASDVKDKIFLATLVRRYCPDARLLFTSSDLLFTHPDCSPSLKGAYVGSTYPLYSRNQRWSFPFTGDRRRLFFPSEQEQGCYNAATVLLEAIGAGREGAKGKPPTLVDYGIPFVRPRSGGNPNDPDCLGSKLRPPIWISVVGQNGLQPLAYVKPSPKVRPCPLEGVYGVTVDDPPAADAGPERQEASFKPQYGSFWITPVLALSLFVLFVGVAYGESLWRRASPPDPAGRGDPLFDLTSLFLPARTGGRSQAAYVLVCLLCVVAAYAGIAFLCNIPVIALLTGGVRVDMEWRHWLLPVLSSLLLVALLTLGLWRLDLHLGHTLTLLPALVALATLAAGCFLVGVSGGLGWGVLVCLALPAAYALIQYCRHLHRTVGLGPGLGRLFFPVARVPARAARASWHYTRLLFARSGQAQAGGPADPAAQGTRHPALGWLRRRLEPLWQAWSRVPWLVTVTVPLAAFTVAYWLVRASRIQWDTHPERLLLLFDRGTDLTGGNSPIIPLLFVGLGLFGWGYLRLKQLHLLDRHAVEPPFPKQGAVFGALSDRHGEVMAALERPRGPLRRGYLWVIWLVLLFAECRLWSRFGPTPEGVLYDGLLLLGLSLLAVVVLDAVLELLRVWAALGRLLRELARLPLGGAYRRLPAWITGAFGPFLSTGRSDRGAYLEYRCRQAERVQEGYAELNLSDFQQGRLEPSADLEAKANPSPGTAAAEGRVPVYLTTTARACLAALFSGAEEIPPQDDPARPAAADASGAANGKAGQRADGQTPAGEAAEARGGRWRQRAEDFVAVEIAAYLSQYFILMRNLVLFLTLGPLLLLFAVISYPLQPQGLWLLFAGALVVAVAFAALRVFIGIEHDPVVSQIVGGTPNRIDWLQGPFLGNVATSIVPLLGILAAASTDMADLIHSWLDPVFHLLR